MIRRNFKRGQLVRRRFEATQNWQERQALRLGTYIRLSGISRLLDLGV